MLTLTAPPTCSIDSSSHDFARTKPCAGALGSSALVPNHGKHTGTPPRIARPCSHRDFELRKSTSSAPAGFQEVTCAPCRYISPTASGETTRTLGNPPFPSTTWAMPGISNRRWDSAIAPSIGGLLKQGYCSLSRRSATGAIDVLTQLHQACNPRCWCSPGVDLNYKLG